MADFALARSDQGLGGLCYSVVGHPTEEAIAYYLTPLVTNAARTDAFAVALEENALAGSASRLRMIELPVRILWGGSDEIFALGNPAYLDALFVNSRGVRRLEAAKLFFPEEYPDLIAAEAQALWT